MFVLAPCVSVFLFFLGLWAFVVGVLFSFPPFLLPFSFSFFLCCRLPSFFQRSPSFFRAFFLAPSLHPILIASLFACFFFGCRFFSSLVDDETSRQLQSRPIVLAHQTLIIVRVAVVPTSSGGARHWMTPRQTRNNRADDESPKREKE